MFRGSLLPNPGPRVSDPRHQLEADLADCYVLERELGRGGMATVYLARDLKLGDRQSDIWTTEVEGLTR